MERDHDPQGISLDAWLDAVRAELAGSPGAAAPALGRDEQRALLELTRVAAHRSERIAAPITAFLVGLALAPVDPGRRAAEIVRLTAALDRRD